MSSRLRLRRSLSFSSAILSASGLSSISMSAEGDVGADRRGRCASGVIGDAAEVSGGVDDGGSRVADEVGPEVRARLCSSCFGNHVGPIGPVGPANRTRPCRRPSSSPAFMSVSDGAADARVEAGRVAGPWAWEPRSTEGSGPSFIPMKAVLCSCTAWVSGSSSAPLDLARSSWRSCDRLNRGSPMLTPARTRARPCLPWACTRLTNLKHGVTLLATRHGHDVVGMHPSIIQTRCRCCCHDSESEVFASNPHQ
mmetsp:Transcript_39291/g.121469  ORF Transcript_39291/g.121469 Transcript_39291/m.121469 type:complete len:253 (-) Transcript_39291:23-781(-)